MKNESKEEVEGHPRFWFMDLEEEPHYEDLRKSIENDELIGLVDEKEGGIVAYIIKGNPEILKRFGLEE